MATECRRTKGKRINRNKLMKVYAYGILLLLVIIGGVLGLLIGRATAPVKTEIVTETVTVEVPVYEADKLPELGEVFYYDVPLSDSLQRYIYEVCADEGVPVSLVLAMIEHESRFNPEVVSSTDDYGLMQINICNHEWLCEELDIVNLLDPEQNILAGVYIISSHLEATDGDIPLALMRYNCGATGAKRLWEQGIYSTSYTEKVITAYENYKK